MTPNCAVEIFVDYMIKGIFAFAGGWGGVVFSVQFVCLFFSRITGKNTHSNSHETWWTGVTQTRGKKSFNFGVNPKTIIGLGRINVTYTTEAS